MDLKERAAKLTELLKEEYPIPECTLDHEEAWQLLFNARLAAQCTDKRVNEVAIGLYARYPTLEDFANADIAELEELVRPTGFFRMKARDLKNAAILMLARHGGRVPDTMEELLELPGVGRKVANLILGDVYKLPGAVVADTHCIRLSNRMGLCDTKDPKKVEFALRELLDPAESNDFCHRLVLHGRAVCDARKPKCEACRLAPFCSTAGADQN